MVTNFLHGVRARYIDTVPRPVRVVPSAIILLIGSAPTYLLEPGNVTIDDPARLLNDVDDSLFAGGKRPGFTIPAALDALRDNGAGTVEIVNVFDAATHKTTAQAIAYTFPTTGTSVDVIQLLRVTGTAPSQAKTTINAEGLTGTFTVTGPGGTPSYTIDTDYTYDPLTGRLTRVVGGTISSGASVLVTYDYADPGKVLAADVIGEVVDGDRSGLQAAYDIYNLRGYRPKIIICPGYSDSASVSVEMLAVAEKLEAMALIDAPAGVTRDEAIAGRSGTSPVTNFNTASRRAQLLYPRVIASDGTSQPYSQFFAGVMARTDENFGYWWSPSNKPIQGIIGIERKLTADFTDDDTDVNALNAAGITTIYNNFGTGFLTWGNRTALYPSDTTPLNFTPVSRTIDIFHESLVLASLPYVDRPINDALVDAITAGANNFIREQVILGALIEGSTCFYEPGKNPASAIAAGRITFSISLAIPTPAETIIYESTYDINLLSNIGTAIAS